MEAFIMSMPPATTAAFLTPLSIGNTLQETDPHRTFRSVQWTASLSGVGRSVTYPLRRLFLPALSVAWDCGPQRGAKQPAGTTPRVKGSGFFTEENTMGMDVIGRDPGDKRGEYFRASVWSWQLLLEAMIRSCGDFLDRELLETMGFNDGAGPLNQKTCSLIADRIESLLEEAPGGFQVWGELRKTTSGRLLDADEARALPPEVETTTPFVTDGEQVKEFIDFLRHCGGFCFY